MEDKFQNLKVMVIDDSKTIRRTAETLLQREGCEVITAVDGFEALSKIAETNRAYKDYVQAEKYYSIVYTKDEEGELFPEALLYYALMQKQNGKYKEALDHFKTAKKNQKKQKSRR